MNPNPLQFLESMIQRHPGEEDLAFIKRAEAEGLRLQEMARSKLKELGAHSPKDGQAQED